jgi:GAF domain-containing protein
MATQPDRTLDAALSALVAAAQRAVIARRVAGDVETALLQSVVDAAATLFDAEAASIALVERDPDRLEFRVAAGAQGAGVVGLSVPPTQGIVGFVHSSGQPIALSDVRSDPRFDQGTAQRTGYVPRSIAATPLVTGGSGVGVLQVLDKHSAPTFTLRDMELLAVFARQAAAAIDASRVQRDAALLVRRAVADAAAGDLSDEAEDTLLAALSDALDRDAEDPFWRLVDGVARLRGMSDRELALVTEMLAVVGRHAPPPLRSARRRRGDPERT